MSRITADTDFISLPAIARVKEVSVEHILDVARELGIKFARTPTNRIATSFKTALILCKAIDGTK